MPRLYPVSTAHNHDAVYSLTTHDHDTDYLGITAKAADSDKVDGAHASATPTANTIPIADANGKLDGWVTNTGGVTDHGALTGLSDDDHTQYVKHSLATAVSDFLVASGAGAFVKKTLAEVKTILGLGSAAYTASTDYLAANGKAADSDLLDNHDTSYFATADHNHSGVYPGVDGWIPVSATWTYASATTITVPSGAAAIYKVGQGLKLNNTDLKYFYIVGVADTVLTITGGSDYTLDSDAISAISYTNTPGTAIGFPRSFNYTPTFTGFSANPTWWLSIFTVSGTMCIYTFYLNQPGTSNSTAFSISLPITVYEVAIASMGYAVDNGNLLNGSQMGIAQGASISLYTSRGLSGWTASGSKGATFTVVYQI